MTKSKPPVSHALALPAPLDGITTKCGTAVGDKRIADHGLNQDAPTCIPCAAVVAAERKLAEYKRGPVPARLEPYYEWAVGGDAGISSKTLVQAITGAKLLGTWGASPPRDPDDFGRCYRVLERFPELRAQLHVVAEKHPEWAGLVAHWGELEALWREESKKRSAPKLYARMKALGA